MSRRTRPDPLAAAEPKRRGRKQPPRPERGPRPTGRAAAVPEIVPRGRGRPVEINAQLISEIAELVQLGAYPHVAAQACGVPLSTHWRWMSNGKLGLGPYVEYWEQLTRALAKARALAEGMVRGQNPLAWLTYGPGRETVESPGWVRAAQLIPPEGKPLEGAGTEQLRAALRQLTDEELQMYRHLRARLATIAGAETQPQAEAL